MSAAPIRDFDFHPDEPDVRLFKMPRCGVLCLDDRLFVAEVRYGDVVLRHYAFGDRWFKINVTTDMEGNFIETGPASDSRRFAFNCDIATPMETDGDAAYAVDLFLDVLVGRDARTHATYDHREFDDAVRSALIPPVEASGARRGLAELVALIERGDLMAFVRDLHPFGPTAAPPALAESRVPLSAVPRLQPGRRRT